MTGIEISRVLPAKSRPGEISYRAQFLGEIPKQLKTSLLYTHGERGTQPDYRAVAMIPMYSNLEPNGKQHPEPPAENAIPYPAFLLSRVYLEAGLPPEAALRSAMADYEHSFSSWELKLL
jgi:hypothetical protein